MVTWFLFLIQRLCLNPHASPGIEDVGLGDNLCKSIYIWKVSNMPSSSLKSPWPSVSYGYVNTILQVMVYCLTAQAVPWTNVDLTSEKPRGTILCDSMPAMQHAIYQSMFQTSNTVSIITLKILGTYPRNQWLKGLSDKLPKIKHWTEATLAANKITCGRL